MKGIALATIIYIFSVVIPIQSREIVYTYNYDNFGDFFHQGAREDFNIYKYQAIDKIFDTEYNGTNVGGVFLVQGSSATSTPDFEGYVVNITATFYCGSTHDEEGRNSLWIAVYYDKNEDFTYLCQERGWHYNHTWIPPLGTTYKNFSLYIRASDATLNKAYGFDELRFTTSDTPPQLLHLQRDNNTSSN